MTGRRRRSWKWIVLWVVVALVVIFAIMQAVPYGRDHADPPVTNAFTWTDPQAEAIARESCYDCHSNETKWWWATNIAPFSWLVQADTNGGREHLNFSEYTGQPSVEEFQRAVEGEMPPFQYTMIHRGAKLTDAERQTLITGYADGMAASGAASGGTQGSGQGDSSATASTTSSDAAAVAVINQACSSCHSAAPALSFHAGGAAEAQALIDNMVKRGATLTAEQQQLLVTYFTR